MKQREATRRMSFVVVAMLVAPALAAAESPAAAAGKVWRASYRPSNGETFSTRNQEPGGLSKLDISIGPEKILCREKKGQALEIPAATVTQIAYDNNRGHYFLRAQARFWQDNVWSPLGTISGGTGPDALIGMFSFISIGVPMMAVSAPFKSTHHFVYIRWQEGAKERAAVFRLSGSDYKPFLAALQEATGKEWTDLPRERQRLEAELKRAAAGKTPLWLDQQAKGGQAVLEPGQYQLVLLERGNGRGELCFFEGKRVDPRNLVDVASVEIATEAGGTVTPQVIREGREGNARISEIRLQDKTLRLAR